VNPALLTTTQAVDTAFYVIFGISALMLLGVTIAMVWFVWRYNRRRQPRPLSQKDHNVWLEVTWTIIPTVLVMLMFWYGWEGYLSLRTIPEGAMPVRAQARMWSWLFTYENGATADKLYVPVGTPVKVELSSVDVLHSFYIPAYRIKRDMVPGMTTYAWFVADKAGSFDIFCAEYCGVGHSAMITSVEALPPEEFETWLAQGSPTAQDPGEELLASLGCLGCHSRDGSPLVGPSFQGLAGRTVRVEKDGRVQELVVDEAYLRRALLEPNAEIVEGYPPVMPPYGGQLDETQLQALLDTLLERTQHTAKPDGAALAAQNGCLGCHSVDGTPLIGPSFLGIAGRPTSVRRGDQQLTITADRDYLRRSILEPGAELVNGYPAAMPPYSHLQEAEIEALVDYMEQLK